MSAPAQAIVRPASRSAPSADRFVAFAFAAADLLVETDCAGLISFATGAFRTRFGVEGETFLGRPITYLFTPPDASVLGDMLATIGQRGRIAPLALHLADSGTSPASVAALMMPASGERPARLCFSIGPIAAPPSAVQVPAERVSTPDRFARIAEETLRSGQSAKLNLVEIKGLGGGRGASATEGAELAECIARTLIDGAPGVTAGRLGDGRYGLLSPSEADVGALVLRLEALLRETPSGRLAKVTGTSLNLASGGLTTAQAARALRYALGRFIDGGTAATVAAGGGEGLAGIFATAEARTLGLRDAIAGRRFRLAFQPVVSLADRKIHHYEALLRPIATPGSPVQSTQDFVTFAEAVGLSEALDWAVLQSAIETLIACPGASVAVNVSGLSMQNPEYRARLIDRVTELRQLPERPGERLLVELTETAEIDDLKGASASIDALRAAGVPVCLDDFGAGSAALRYLRAFQVDYVKIDGVYVRGADTNPRDRGFVASIVELAETVGAQVVAEMIETDEQATIMRDLGVRFGQGWLYGRPGLLPGGR